MSEITTTPASGRGRGRRPRRLRRLMTGVAGAVAAMVLASGVTAGAFAPPAKADVNTNDLYGWARWSDCTIHVGNFYNYPQNYAIGDTTIYCSSYHNIAVHTRLYRSVDGYNYTLVRTSRPSPYSTFWNYRTVHDVQTDPYICGGPAAWYTLSWISIDGSAWWWIKSPEHFYKPGC